MCYYQLARVLLVSEPATLCSLYVLLAQLSMQPTSAYVFALQEAGLRTPL
jgi:hypothetical protein